MKDFTTASNATETTQISWESIKETIRKFRDVVAEVPGEAAFIVGDEEMAWLREHVPPAEPYKGFATPIPFGGVEILHSPFARGFTPIPKQVARQLRTSQREFVG
jgi:hypothetical protein